MKKLTIEEVKKRAKDIGTWEVLDVVYVNAFTKLTCKCNKCCHVHKINWNNIQKGIGCPYCAGKRSPLIESIRKQFEKEGYILLTKKYKNNTQKLNYICTKGHQHSISWSNWRKKHRCPYCDGNVKLTVNFIKKEFKKESYTLLTKIYENNHQKLDYICSKGHKHYISWNNWQKGQRCSKCFNNVSKWEKTVKKFLDSLYISYISNDRTQLINLKTGHNFELDIWFPELNKAIECNGTYWHSLEKMMVRDKIKQQLCKDQGIYLLTIAEEDWTKDIDKCKTKIKNFVAGE